MRKTDTSVTDVHGIFSDFLILKKWEMSVRNVYLKLGLSFLNAQLLFKSFCTNVHQTVIRITRRASETFILVGTHLFLS